MLYIKKLNALYKELNALYKELNALCNEISYTKKFDSLHLYIS